MHEAHEQEIKGPSQFVRDERPARFHAIGEELRQAGRIDEWQRLSPGETNELGLPPGANGTEALVEGLSRHCSGYCWSLLRSGGKFEARVVGGDFHARYVPGKLDLTKKL